MHTISVVWGKCFECVVQALSKPMAEIENTSRDGPEPSLTQNTALSYKAVHNQTKHFAWALTEGGQHWYMNGSLIKLKLEMSGFNPFLAMQINILM